MGELQIHKEKNTLDSIFGPIQDNALEKNKELNLQRSKSLPGAPGSLLGDANKIKPNATVENLPVKLPPAQAKKAAPGQALLQVAPAVKVKKSLGAKVRAFFHLQSKTDKAKQRVGEDNAALRMMAAEAQRVLSSFNPDKEISSYSIFRRKKMYYRKKDCREQALALNKDYLAESARWSRSARYRSKACPYKNTPDASL